MSLTGNIEDLPLLDIIQIVSFSKKTGYLTIRTSGGEAAIVFDEGNVVSAFTWDSPPVDPRVRTLPEAKRAGLIRNRIEMALQQLIRLHEGQFSFSLADEAPRSVGSRDIRDETLPGGINAQEVLLDLARGMDEDRRDSAAAIEASFAEPGTGEIAVEAPAPEGDEEAAGEPGEERAEEEPGAAPLPEPAMPAPARREPDLLSELALPLEEPRAATRAAARPAEPAAPAAAEPVRSLLLVDDEEDVRRILAGHFAAAGYEVTDAGDPDEAVKKAGVLGKSGRRFLLVTDLGMPASGGASFQGGFEVVKRLWKMNLRPPVLLMTDSLGATVQARARQMGISSFVFKPGLSKLDPEQFAADMKAFAGKIVRDVLPRLERAGTEEAGKKRKAAPAGEARGPVSADQVSRELALLQQYLEALRRPNDPSQITALVMQVAREFFERAVLFVVKDDRVRGLGGFGKAPKDESLNLLVRDISIPLDEPSVFLEAIQTGRTFAGPLPEGRWTSHLVGRIGRFASARAALLPLLAHRETIALVYGDNPETDREFARLESLELFMTQAGIAMENAFLQRKLESLQSR